jgi:hypothetical protein
MATEEELKGIIRKKRGGRWIEYHGPYKIGAADVWEIWTWTNENKKDKDDWTPQTRFWLEDENGSKLYFAYFADLTAYLNKEIEAFKLKRLSLYVSSFAFLAAVLAVIALLFTDRPASPWLALVAVAGLVSSGATFFFGVWRPIDSEIHEIHALQRSPSCL